jgi:predicted ATPase
VGENGTGKSTLIEAIAVGLGFNPEGGTKQSQFTTNRTHSELHRYLRTVRSFKKPGDEYFLRAESFYNLATFMEETGYLRGYGGKSLHQQSHGESFMATLLHKLTGGGLYIMDEPEAALSPSRQMAALSAIHNLVEQESQFIIATHSPILLAYPRACIYQLDEDGINKVEYEQTEHYSVTRQFLNSYQQLLTILMEP